MSIETVLKKVRALRELSKSSNVNEAAAAAAAADKLLQEYRLSEVELGTGTERTEAINAESAPLYSAGRVQTWRKRLALRLAAHYGCHILLSTLLGDTHIVLIGRPSDALLVRDMFAWLSTEAARLTASFARARKAAGLACGAAQRNAYLMGIVTGVGEALVASKQAAEADHARHQGNKAALVLQSRADEAMQWARSAFNPKRMTLRGSVSDGRAYASGKAAGANIHLGASLPSSGVRALPR